MKAFVDDPRQARNPMGWQVLSYNRRTHIANVHVGFYGNCCNSSKIFRMGLSLKVRPEFQSVFQKALSQGLIDLHPEKYNERKKAKYERAFSLYVDLSIPDVRN